MIVSKQDCRSVRVVVVVIQDDSVLIIEPASGRIGERDFQMSRKGLMVLFPSPKNFINSTEENTLREERESGALQNSHQFD